MLKWCLPPVPFALVRNQLRLLVVVGLCCCSSLSAAQKWQAKFVFDENDRSLTITDLKFPSAERGFAAGVIGTTGKGFLGHEKQIPVILLTVDSGRTWTQVEVKEAANSLFFLDGSTGWLVADGGIWFTDESGRSWKRICTVKHLEQVYFLTRTHGFAVGSEHRALETNDGGSTWKPITMAGDAPALAKDTTYLTVAFANKDVGFISGERHRVTDEDRDPAWWNADEPGSSERKFIDIFLATSDGGKTWKLSAQEFYGALIRASLTGPQTGLALLEFQKHYPWPSEVYRLRLKLEQSSERVYRQKDRTITDVLLLDNGTAYLAGFQLPGKVHPSPIPGKVKMVVSRDFQNWREIPVDYRAVARRVWLAASDPDNVWAATDTGMLLKLENVSE